MNEEIYGAVMLLSFLGVIMGPGLWMEGRRRLFNYRETESYFFIEWLGCYATLGGVAVLAFNLWQITKEMLAL